MRKIRIPKDLLESLYVEQGQTLESIAVEFGVNRQTICNKLREYGITIRNSAFIRSQKRATQKRQLALLKPASDYRSKEVFEEVYKRLKSLDLVAEHFGINIKTAFFWKKEHGIETVREFSQKGRAKVNVDKPYANKEWLEKMYAQHSFEDLGKMLNCSPSTISKWAQRFGIPSRTPSEQWAVKEKFGAQLVKPSGFDMQFYKQTYVTERVESLPRHLREYIASLFGACEACGYSEVLDVHHIDENRKNNDPSNHAVLCPNCHAKLHRLGIPFRVLVPNHVSWETLIDTYQDAK